MGRSRRRCGGEPFEPRVITGSGPALPALLQRFRDIVGTEHVITEPEVMASYAVDWTGRFEGACRLVVLRPRDGAEVAAVVARCTEDGVALVPQGQHGPGWGRRPARR